MTKTSLVTGGAGFIGSHVVDCLIAEGHQVIVIDDLSGGFKSNLNPKAQFIKGSVTNLKLLQQVFTNNRIDYVFHLAAYAAEGLSHHIRRFNYQNNLIGSVNLINLSILHHIKRFIFTSSIAVYGTNQTPMVESQNPAPQDPYGIAKYAIELDLMAAQEMFGLNYTIFRPHNVYGPRQNTADPYRNVLGIFINKILQGKPMTIFGDGRQQRAFTYVGDIAPLIAKSVDLPQTANQIFNIGADQPCTVLDLAHLIARTMNVKADIEFLPKRHEVDSAYADHSKLYRLFGRFAPTPLELGIKQMVDRALKTGPKQPKKFSHIEICRQLPPSWQKLNKI